jgi:hypothetical protein
VLPKNGDCFNPRQAKAVRNYAFLLCGLDTGLKMIIIMVGRRQGAFAGIFSLAGKPSLGLSTPCKRQHQSFDGIPAATCSTRIF